MDGELLIAKTSGSRALTVQQALQEGTRLLSQAGIESARLDAEVLLRHWLGVAQEALYRNPERPLSMEEHKLFHQALLRRTRGEPIAYITGHREFWSLDFIVTPDVLVPRPETERLVEVALEGLGESGKAIKYTILDLGTGSGVLAVSLAKERGDSEIWATDISAEALGVAAENAARHGITDRIRLLQGDLFGPIRGRKRFFDMIVSNPPYIRRKEFSTLPLEVRDWEPRIALDGGADGLDFYRRVAREAHSYLVEEGFLVLEIGADMAQEVRRLFAETGYYSAISVFQDYAGRDRVVVARKNRGVDG